MKNAEIILGTMVFVALTLNLLFIPGGGIITVVTLSTVSIFYMYFSFALFNDIKRSNIFKKESYHGISRLRIVGAVLTGFALSFTILGILFRFQSWPGSSVNLGVGLFGLLIASIVGLLKYQKSKSVYYTKIFKRIAVYGGFGLIIMILPKLTLLEMKYRNYPEYIEAVKRAIDDPENQELREIMYKEQQKIQ